MEWGIVTFNGITFNPRDVTDFTYDQDIHLGPVVMWRLGFVNGSNINLVLSRSETEQLLECLFEKEEVTCTKCNGSGKMVKNTRRKN